jgi:hypothetical protein
MPSRRSERERLKGTGRDCPCLVVRRQTAIYLCNTSQTNVAQTPRQIPMVAIWVSLFIRFEDFHAEDSD